MRDYNYRKAQKLKSKKRMIKLSWASSKTTTPPRTKKNDLYVLEGLKSNYKKKIKKQARKRERSIKFKETKDGSNYKRHLDLPWILS